tara:strand:- start:243 stop:719 length:477 start_codon:yes stop_codon:yes gene_type:complete
MDWNMLNKTIALVLTFCLVSLPTIALADEPLLPPAGKITGLRYKQPAPYSGVLLNSVAAAKLLTNKDFSDKQWELRLEYKLAKQSALLNLTIESQKVSHQALEKKHFTLMNIKDDEIERLSKIAANTNDYSRWWAVGGVVVGIALALVTVYGVKEITK